MGKIVLIEEEVLKSYINEIKLAVDDLKSNHFNPVRPKFYRNKEIKEIFGLSDGTIINWRKRNILPYTYIDKIYYYPVNQINELLKNNSNYNLM